MGETLPPETSIMIPRLQEIDTVVADEVDQAVFLGEAAGPDAGGEIFEGFRLTDAGEGVAHDGLAVTSQYRLPGGGFRWNRVRPPA